MRALLSNECGFYGDHEKPSAISHPRAEMVCFATQAFAEEEAIGFFYGSLIFKTLLDPLNGREVHGGGFDRG